MIWLVKASENIIAISASENATLDEFFFLFRFVHVELKKEFFLYKDSDNPGSPRYDKFIINMPDDIDLPSGNYQYYVYQSEDEESEDYESMVLLETGKLTVPDEQRQATTFQPNASTEDITLTFS